MGSFGINLKIYIFLKNLWTFYIENSKKIKFENN
jgi:hypothetical protein